MGRGPGKLSVIIPTLNAAAVLPATLRALGETGGRGRARDGNADVAGGDREPATLIAEILVVDGGSCDDTRAIAGSLGATVIAAGTGRGPQLAAGAAAAGQPWLLFLHADTRLGCGWREAVRDHMADPRNEERAGYFRFALDDDHRAARRLEAAVRFRNRAFGLPYGDQGLVISRRFYEAVGGYKPIPLMEDVDLVRRIGRRRLVMLEGEALTSAERYRRGGYHLRPLRNGFCIGLYWAGVPPRLINAIYR